MTSAASTTAIEAAGSGPGAAEDPSVDWMNADYADGPALAAWLRSLGLPDESRGADDVRKFWRRLRGWEEGERAGFATVDIHLTTLGYHVSEVPDECWRVGGVRGNRVGRSDPVLRQQVLDAYKRIGTIRGTIRETGIPRRTLLRWVQTDNLAPSPYQPLAECKVAGAKTSEKAAA